MPLHAAPTLHNLRCEMLNNPESIGVSMPRFSWEITSSNVNVAQTAYCILAAELGADGLELDLGGLGKRASFDNKLTEKAFQELFISEANRLGVEFSSLALSAFYGQSFATRENCEALIDEA
ncbi:MAG: hypothetical protein LBB79_03410, partial [Prevotellaceae bacterium]|nr:hypothetical protein [Prevotellaceae bacterium]